ncbi:MAG: helix-hairpin-helix domain-containing protein [Bacteroidales bacterium]|nr:helix-hairpin-helix domain-containing protein [Bacteroidales bacterium]
MKLIKEYFSFTKSEIRGLMIILVIIIVLIGIRFIERKNASGFNIVYTTFSYKSDKKEEANTKMKLCGKECNSALTCSKGELYEANFDPNTATYDVMLSKGFAMDIVVQIMNYRAKGGRFNKPCDLLKIYGIDSALVMALLEKISIEPHDNCFENTVKKMPNPLIIDINRADSIQLQSVFGIGKVLSSRIVKYRDLLGGYYSTTQLNEVYGISDSLCSGFSSIFTIDTACIRKINLNMATIYDLKKHPYLNYYEAKAIVSYRRLIGPFESKKQLIDNYLLSETTYLKVAPYLTLR